MGLNRDSLTPYSTWKHVKRGTLYTVLGVGLCTTNGERGEVEESVVYIGHDWQGLLYREVEEFLDGRFVPVPANDEG